MVKAQEQEQDRRARHRLSRRDGFNQTVAWRCRTVNAIFSPRILTVPRRSHRLKVRRPNSRNCFPMCSPDEISLNDLIRLLEKDAGGVGPAEMADILHRLAVSPEELAGHALFSEKRYARNLVHKTSGFEIMIMCWNAGQRSSIHD